MLFDFIANFISERRIVFFRKQREYNGRKEKHYFLLERSEELVLHTALYAGPFSFKQHLNEVFSFKK